MFVKHSNGHGKPMQAWVSRGHFLWFPLAGLRSRSDQKE